MTTPHRGSGLRRVLLVVVHWSARRAEGVRRRPGRLRHRRQAASIGAAEGRDAVLVSTAWHPGELLRAWVGPRRLMLHLKIGIEVIAVKRLVEDSVTDEPQLELD